MQRNTSTPAAPPSTSVAPTGPSPLASMFGSGANGNLAIPQSLEQLLERQWEQGSQFLMEQAQHFDSKWNQYLSMRVNFNNNVHFPYSCLPIVLFASITNGECTLRRACF